VLSTKPFDSGLGRKGISAQFTTKERWEITAEIVWGNGGGFEFAYPGRSHPLAQWLDSEWQQFGAQQVKPWLVFVHTGRTRGMSFQPNEHHPELHPLILIESGTLKTLTSNEQRALLSHEIDHALRTEPDYYSHVRVCEYLADAGAALRTDKQSVIGFLKKAEVELWPWHSDDKVFGRSNVRHPSLASRIKALVNETYYTQAEELYKSRLSAALSTRLGRVPPSTTEQAAGLQLNARTSEKVTNQPSPDIPKQQQHRRPPGYGFGFGLKR
jgi:hypothetical protein